MLGNLFYRKVTPGELKEMSYKELMYWNDWHKMIDKKEASLIPNG